MTETIEMTAEVIEPTKELQAVYTPAVIDDNLAALEAYIDEQIEPYVGAVIDPGDEEQVKQARACMADLNKMKAPIEEERKRIKKAYNAPLAAFEGRVKGITSKIDAARSGLKEQVDAADAAFREKRKAKLAEEYEGVAGAMADVVPFDAVLDPSWLNRSTVEAKALAAVADKAEAALKGYDALLAQNLNHKDEVLKRYAETLDMTFSLELEAKLNERDAEMAAFKAAQEAAGMAEKEPSEPEPQPMAPAQGGQDRRFLWCLSMEFEGTREQAQAVADALKELGVSGAVIKCVKEVG